MASRDDNAVAFDLVENAVAREPDERTRLQDNKIFF